jgi:hypothetical protein
MSPDNLEILALFEDILMYSILRNGPFFSDLVLIPKGVELFNSPVVSISDLTPAFPSSSSLQKLSSSGQYDVLVVKLSGIENDYVPRKKIVRRAIVAPADDSSSNFDNMAGSIGAIEPVLPPAPNDPVDEVKSRHRKKKHKSDKYEYEKEGEDERNKSSKRRRKDKPSAASGAALMQTALALRIDALTDRCAKLRVVLAEKRRSVSIMQMSIARSVAQTRRVSDRSKPSFLLPDSAVFSMKSVFPHLLKVGE